MKTTANPNGTQRGGSRPHIWFLLFALMCLGAAGPIINKLNDLSDVQTARPPNDGDALVYDAVARRWVNSANLNVGDIVATNIYVSNFYATNFYVTTNFIQNVTNYYSTNIYVTNIVSEFISNYDTIITSNFFTTNISVQNFEYVSNLYTTNIYTTNLYATNIYNSNFFTTNLTVQNITNVTLVTSNLYTTNLFVTNLTVNNITNVSNQYVTNLYTTNLYATNIYNSNTYTTNLTVQNITNVTLLTSNLYTTNLYVTNLYASNFYASNFFITNLYTSNLYTTNLYTSNFFTTNFYSTNLYATNIYNSNFFSTNITVQNITNVTLITSNLFTTNLYTSNFFSTNVFTTNLYVTNITIGGTLQVLYHDFTGSTNIDVALSSWQGATLSANTAFTLTNSANGINPLLKFSEDGTGGWVPTIAGIDQWDTPTNNWATNANAVNYVRILNAGGTVHALLDGTNFPSGRIEPIAALTWASTVTISLDGSQPNYRTLILGGHTTIATSNRGAGRWFTCIITGAATNCNLSLPWTHYMNSSAPTSLAANKVASVTVFYVDGTDAAAVVNYAVEP